jgi:hypothetical protein
VVGDPGKLALARRDIEASGRSVTISVGLYCSEWPADDGERKLAELHAQDVARVFINLATPFTLLPRLDDLVATRHGPS